MIRKFFGQGDLFIKAKSATTLKGVNYEEGDIIAYFIAVELALGYQLMHKEGASTKREMSYIERQPYSLTVGSVPNTAQVDRLFFKETKRVEVEYSTARTYSDVDEMILLQEMQSPIKVKTFIHGEEVKGVVDLQERTVTFGDDVTKGERIKEVDVVSTFVDSGEERGFDKPELGYFSLEGTIKGKFGDLDGTFVLNIPLAHMISEPVMDLSPESNYHLNLSFALINDIANPPKVVFING